MEQREQQQIHQFLSNRMDRLEDDLSKQTTVLSNRMERVKSDLSREIEHLERGQEKLSKDFAVLSARVTTHVTWISAGISTLVALIAWLAPKVVR